MSGDQIAVEQQAIREAEKDVQFCKELMASSNPADSVRRHWAREMKEAARGAIRWHTERLKNFQAQQETKDDE